MSAPRPALLGLCVAAVLTAAVAVALATGPVGPSFPRGSVTPAAAQRHVPSPSGTAAPVLSASRLPASRPAWTRASVATVWLRPAKARPVDRPALRRTPDIDRWVQRQTLTEREALTGRVLTQAVRGEQVRVLREHAGWSRVRLPQQRGSYFRHGIVGWVPSRQLTAQAPKHTRPAATQRTHRRPTDAGAAALAVAQHYLGVRYLWGGMTRAGIDCSGLTYQAFRAAGRTLPRDAADQARMGRPVHRRHLRPGDLVFFGPGNWTTVHHVGIYAGNGLVLHAPHTGSAVQLTPLSAWSDYWGARRLR